MIIIIFLYFIYFCFYNIQLTITVYIPADIPYLLVFAKGCYFCFIKVAQKLLADLCEQFESHWFPFLSGCEFVKAVSGFNCRLCKTFIRCGNDVISHIRGKKHQKNYQVYLTLNQHLL